MSRSFHRVVLGLSVALIAVALLGGFGPAGVSANQSTGAYRQMGVYEEVLHKIQTDYVTKPDLETVTDGALHGLLQSLDPDSGYFTPAQWTSYQEHQKDGKAGPGMIVSKRYGYGSVVSVLPGSPAQEAHIQDGDLINSVEGQSTRDMSVSMIRALLHGQPGTEVKFQLVRPAKPQPVDMRRLCETSGCCTFMATAWPRTSRRRKPGSSVRSLRATPGPKRISHGLGGPRPKTC